MRCVGVWEVVFVIFTYPDDLDSKQALVWCLEVSRMQITTRNKRILMPCTISSTLVTSFPQK